MTRFLRTALVTLSLAALGLAAVSAHHSIQAQFDINKTIMISGTVAKVEWINPHSYLTLNVKDDTGKVQKWAFEMASAGQLRGTGLSRADRGGLKLGDEVTVTALASRDGSPTALAQEIKVADGRVFRLSNDTPQQ